MSQDYMPLGSRFYKAIDIIQFAALPRAIIIAIDRFTLDQKYTSHDIACYKIMEFLDNIPYNPLLSPMTPTIKSYLIDALDDSIQSRV
jgi:hypothetical protein